MRAVKSTTVQIEAAMKVQEEKLIPYEMVHYMASCKAVVVFSMNGCCMSTVAKHLLINLGVAPTIVEIDEHPAGHVIQTALNQLIGSHHQHQQPVPAVFIGGKFLGGVQTLMTCHINGTLVPLLKDAGALWL